MKAHKSGVKLGNILGDRSIRFNIAKIADDALYALDKDYQIFKIRCKGFANRNHLSAALRKQEWVKAVRNSGYGVDYDDDLRLSVFVLCDKHGDNDSKIDKLVTDLNDPDTGHPIDVGIPKVPAEVVLQLLANSLHHRDADRINNVLGRCLEVIDYKNYSGDKKDVAKEVICLEYIFRRLPSLTCSDEEDVALTFKVVTLTNIREKKNIDFKKGKNINSYPHFVKDRYGLRIADPVKDVHEEQFIERTTKYHEKNTVVFFHSWSLDVLSDSRSAHVNKIIDKINIYYPELGLELKRIDTEIFEPVGNTSNVYHNELARRLVETSNFGFINLAGEEYGPLFDEIKEHFLLIKRPSLDGYFDKPKEIRIVVIRNEGYYLEEKRFDEYLRPIDADCVQHITVESIECALVDCKTDSDRKSFWKILVENSLENIAVKLENVKHSMLLTKWPLYDLEGNALKKCFTFAIRARELEDDSEEEPNPVFVSVTIDQEGSFGGISYLDDESEDHYELFKALNIDPVNIELAVEDEKGNINLVWSTDYVTMPETQPMEEKILENKEKGINSEGIASREGRNDLYPECVDIGYNVVDDRSMYYYVGMVGPGVKKKFQNAVNVRRVTAYKGSELFFKDLIPTLSVPYVRHDQSTVHPFPCKNLTEWIEDKNKRLRIDNVYNLQP